MSLSHRDGNEAPVSQDTVYKKILSAIKETKDAVNTFQEFKLGQITLNPEKAVTCIQKLCQVADKTFEDVEDTKDLGKILALTSDDGESIGGSEYKNVCEMQDRGDNFEYIAFSIKNLILDAYENYLVKYCLSFLPEAQGIDLNSVITYQDKIDKWEKVLQPKADRILECVTDYQHFKQSFEKYVRDYSQVEGVMREMCAALLDICGPMRGWIMADAQYPRNLQEEITQYLKLKQETQDKVKQILDRRENQSQAVKKRTATISKLQRQTEFLNDNKRHYKRRYADITETMQRYTAELARKKRDLEEAKRSLNPGKKNSRSLQNYIVTATETLKKDVRELSRKMEMSETMLRKLKNDEEAVKTQIEAVAQEIEKQRRVLNEALATIEKTDHHYQRLRENVLSFEQKLTALKTIRELKLNSTTIKRVHNFGYHPGDKVAKDELEQAMKITAMSIGKDWKYLYHSLPFDRERDFLTKEREIDDNRSGTGNLKTRRPRKIVREFEGGLYPRDHVIVHSSMVW